MGNAKPPVTEAQLGVPDEGERQIEMLWHCATCRAENLGRFKSCQGCGKPKGDEEYEMPEHPEKAATVTEAGLLRMAMSGPDWKCAYCGSEQRAIDGACGNCGASASTAVPEPLVEQVTMMPRWRRWYTWAIVGGVALVLLAVFLIWNAHRPRNYEGTVTAVGWEQSIDVEHYANHDHDGFKEQLPTNATDITSIGQKLHHEEQVLDHMETEHYTVEVPDGYRSESYTEQVSCGQDCRTTPTSCHEECTSKRNGFASCKQVCSGGDRSCTTRYCSESRTRQIPQTRTESRTREVPRYRSEPRYAEAFHYKAWDWSHDRTVTSHGIATTDLVWPENGARERGLPEGEMEREERHGTYRVTLRYHDRIVTFAVKTPTELRQFATATEHPVKVIEGRLFVDGSPIEPLPQGLPPLAAP